MNSELANFVLFITDIFIFIFYGMAIYGIRTKRIFALGTWYLKSSNNSQYIQVVIGYIMLGTTLVIFRFFVFPERLYQYL